MDERILMVCERITITESYKETIERQDEAHEVVLKHKNDENVKWALTVTASAIKFSKRLTYVASSSPGFKPEKRQKYLYLIYIALLHNYCLSAMELLNSFNLQTSKKILSIGFGLSILSFACSSVTFILVIIAMIKKRLPRQKYSIVSSRTLSDTIYSVAVIGISYLANNQTASFSVTLLFVLSSTFGVIHLGISHFAVIALKQANAQHLDCFQFLTFRRTITVLVLLWILSILYCTAFISLAAVIVVPKYSAEICTYRSCQKPLLLISLCLIGFLTFGTTIYYIVVAQNLRAAHKKEKIYSKVMITRKSLFNFLNYGGHILFFAVTSSLIFVSTAHAFRSAWIYNKLQIFNECEIISYIDAAIHTENLAGSVMLLYCCRIILDSALLIIVEPTYLLPWISYKNKKTLDNTTSTFPTAEKTNSLKWYCTTANCSITTSEDAINTCCIKN